MSTYMANANTIERRWFVIDAANKPLGRTAVLAANILRGKHRPEFTPHVDCGEFVIIINASKIQMTGKKWTDKEYLSYTGYPGGQRSVTPEKLFQKSPEKLVKKVVKGMLPKNKLGAKQLDNLYVFEGEEHDKQAQQPKVIDINSLR